MLSSGYAILYQKDKRYVYKATFYINKVSHDLKDDFLTYLLVYLC